MASPIAGGILLATKTIDSAVIDPFTFPTPTVEVTLDSAVSIVSGETYAIVASAPDATGATFATGIGWRLWTFDPLYTGGASYDSTDSGDTWGDLGGDNDLHFITKAGATEKDTPSSEGGAASVYFGNTTWFAQSFTAASSYSLTSIVMEMHKGALVDAGDLTIDIYGPVGFSPPAGGPTKKRLIAAANNKVWYETTT